ncbi:MAG: metal ABC transporter permease [Anaerolineales bacterium]|jgi:ABC-type Mn2+/Zn2+ transport system permease subunit
MSDFVAWLVEPLRYPFMLRALWASLIVGVICPILGSYVVLRGMAFVGDALAHIILPGVVIAHLLGWPLALGALIAGVIAALGIAAISRRTVIREDTVVGVIFAGAFALGIALLSLYGNYAVDLTHILFGNMLGVSIADLWLTGSLGLIALATIVIFYKEFLVLSFDPILAATLRLPVNWLQNLLYILTAIVIVVSIQVVGVALVLAMLVTPAATAYMLTRRLWAMMMLAAAIGALSTIVGLYVSFYLNVASGPAVVLVETGIFGLVFILSPQRGILGRWLRNRRNAQASA